jgi:hypothetical protein
VPDIDVALADVGQRLVHPVGDLGRVPQHRDEPRSRPAPRRPGGGGPGATTHVMSLPIRKAYEGSASNKQC